MKIAAPLECEPAIRNGRGRRAGLHDRAAACSWSMALGSAAAAVSAAPLRALAQSRQDR